MIITGPRTISAPAFQYYLSSFKRKLAVIFIYMPDAVVLDTW